MNLVLFLLSFLFASYAPTSQATDDSNPSGKTKTEHGKGKGRRFQDADYIISDDTNP